MEWKDFAGRDIHVGDVIVYAANADRSAILKFGFVKALSQTKEPRRWNMVTHVREFAPTIKCVTLDPWYVSSYNPANVLQKDGKLVTLGFLERVVIVSEVPGVREKFENMMAVAEAFKDGNNR